MGPVIGKYSQHPDSGEPQMPMLCTSPFFIAPQIRVFIKTHRPVVSLPSLFLLLSSYPSRVAAEVGRRLDTISIHLYSLLPLASRKSTSFPRLRPACTHGLTSSAGMGGQRRAPWCRRSAAGYLSDSAWVTSENPREHWRPG